MTIELFNEEDHTEVIQLGSVRISAYLENGKTVLVVNAMNGRDFITVLPQSTNKVIIKAGEKIK